MRIFSKAIAESAGEAGAFCGTRPVVADGAGAAVVAIAPLGAGQLMLGATITGAYWMRWPGCADPLTWNPWFP
jgi:hypothetical protein